EVLSAEAASFDPQLRQATPAQLLSHRSGLAAYASGAELSSVEPIGDTPSAQRSSFALQLLRAPPAQAPGQAFVYSNAGYIVAGVMLERVGGAPIETLMRERLFAPLGMAHTAFGDPAPSETGQPLGHYLRDGAQAVYLEAEPAIPPFLTAAGDVSLPLEDYGAYLREHLCGLRGAPTRLLPAALIADLHQPQGEDGASLGWGAYAFNGAPASIHVGGTGAFSAFVAIIPSRDLAVATVVNSGAPDARTAALSLMQSIIQDPP
ncbi:MAG TPA: serine hydrolase domain-containing protein, partial [Terricaulis sp.]|nr:serine hydrolase domain-containing protein [Terricaulis sp.]